MRKQTSRYLIIFFSVILTVIFTACSGRYSSEITDNFSNKESGAATETVKNTATSKDTIATESSTAENILMITPPEQRVFPIRKENVVSVFQAMGLNVNEIIPTDKNLKTAVFAGDSELLFYFRYEEFSKEQKALESFEAIRTSIIEGETGDPFEGTCDVEKKDAYSLLIACGSYGEKAPIYKVALLVEDSVISGFVYSVEESDKQTVNNLFVGLGYMDQNKSAE